MAEDKTCFVVCPIGELDSKERKWSDDVFEELLKPVAMEHGYTANRSIDDPRPGEITANIVADLIGADLVIADLTYHNANVFYELAIRHAQGTPFFHIAEVGTKIPFDIAAINTVFIDRTTIKAMNRTRRELGRYFEAIRAGTAGFDNPVKRHQQKLRADQSGDPMEKRVLILEEQMARALSITTNLAGRSFLPPSKSNRFLVTNRKVASLADTAMQMALTATKYRLVFNPLTGAAKNITFLEGGDIGEGQNANEHSWRVSDGRLELLDAEGSVFSRFVFDTEHNRYLHTNDPDTQSIKGQYIVAGA